MEISFLLEQFKIIFMFIGFGIWIVFDSYSISRYEGRIKRGIKIWSKELSSDSRQFLSSLKGDIVEDKKILFSTYNLAFIRVQNKEVAIFSAYPEFRSSLLYIGYVDLNSPNPDLEYRTSLSGILFLIPLAIIGLLIIGLVTFIINFFFQTKTIDSFLEKKTQESIQNSKTIHP